MTPRGCAEPTISAAGNSPTWDCTGLVYLPNSNVTFSGAVDKSANGASCFVMVSYTLTINATGDILKNGGCAAAGLSMPSNLVGGREAVSQFSHAFYTSVRRHLSSCHPATRTALPRRGFWGRSEHGPDGFVFSRGLSHDRCSKKGLAASD